MSWDTRLREAFTLVELLVVIGIIALLIAILMPALSRARKQALQASCGSQERQITYAALAYGNDWKEKLPTRMGATVPWSNELDGEPPQDIYSAFLDHYYRLPVIGFDTTTVVMPLEFGAIAAITRYGGCCSTPEPCTSYGGTGVGSWDGGTAGGLAFVMRDYLKNDLDVMVCPDALWDREQSIKKDYFLLHGGYNGWWTCTGASYLWLPYRPDTSDYCTSIRPDVSSRDVPTDIAQTASDKPDLLVTADLIITADTIRVGGNHMISKPSSRLYTKWNFTNIADVTTEAIPDLVPLGSNRSRIDARTTWVPYQQIGWLRFIARVGCLLTYAW